MIKMGRFLAAASSAFGTIAMSHGAANGRAAGKPSRRLSMVDRLPNDYPTYFPLSSDHVAPLKIVHVKYQTALGARTCRR
jgi:hypothetical protein